MSETTKHADVQSIPFNVLKQEIMRREAERDRLVARRDAIDLELEGLGIGGKATVNGHKTPRSKSVRSIVLSLPTGINYTMNELMDAVAIGGGKTSKSTVSVALDGMMKRGEVIRTGRGVYQLVKQDEAPKP